MFVIRKLLNLPGLHYLLTRCGGSRLRSQCFDERYLSGQWDFRNRTSGDLVRVVERYARRGYILMLGCGTGSIANSLSPDSFAGFCGVDISQEAIKLARRYQSARVQFQVGDMAYFQSDRQYDVILFSESLFYIGRVRRKALLRRCQKMLATEGCYVVTIAQPERYANILDMIRRHFLVLEDCKMDKTGRQLLVFRPKR